MAVSLAKNLLPSKLDSGLSSQATDSVSGRFYHIWGGNIVGGEKTARKKLGGLGTLKGTRV